MSSIFVDDQLIVSPEGSQDVSLLPAEIYTETAQLVEQRFGERIERSSLDISDLKNMPEDKFDEVYTVRADVIRSLALDAMVSVFNYPGRELENVHAIFKRKFGELVVDKNDPRYDESIHTMASEFQAPQLAQMGESSISWGVRDHDVFISSLQSYVVDMEYYFAEIGSDNLGVIDSVTGEFHFKEFLRSFNNTAIGIIDGVTSYTDGLGLVRDAFIHEGLNDEILPATGIVRTIKAMLLEEYPHTEDMPEDVGFVFENTNLFLLEANIHGLYRRVQQDSANSEKLMRLSNEEDLDISLTHRYSKIPLDGLKDRYDAVNWEIANPAAAIEDASEQRGRSILIKQHDGSQILAQLVASKELRSTLLRDGNGWVGDELESVIDSAKVLVGLINDLSIALKPTIKGIDTNLILDPILNSIETSGVRSTAKAILSVKINSLPEPTLQFFGVPEEVLDLTLFPDSHAAFKTLKTEESDSSKFRLMVTGVLFTFLKDLWENERNIHTLAGGAGSDASVLRENLKFTRERFPELIADISGSYTALVSDFPNLNPILNPILYFPYLVHDHIYTGGGLKEIPGGGDFDVPIEDVRSAIRDELGAILGREPSMDEILNFWNKEVSKYWGMERFDES